ncbi:MAG: GNAT family N-acetyltransferase [Ilumatobacteraceae bacterium]|jgi:GNAT superfamily N-acetyltransferase|nr:GNAT family N-acetyltransferase [Ilumatobacteraceae bacterium]
MSTNPSITFARRPHDWDAAGHLLGQYQEWLREHITTPVPERLWYELDVERVTIESSFGRPHHLAVAWIGPVPVGILGARVQTERAELTRFFVRPMARGRGVAPLLLASMLHRLASHGLTEVGLVTSPADMPAAARLYERFGFEPTAAATACGGLVHMARQLEPHAVVVQEVG